MLRPESGSGGPCHIDKWQGIKKAEIFAQVV